MADQPSAREQKFVETQAKKAEEKKEEKAEVKLEEKKAEGKKIEEKPKTPGIKEGEKKIEKKEEKPGEKMKEEKAPEKKAEKPAEKKEEKKEEKDETKREIVLERIYTVPFMEIYSKPQQFRGNAALVFLKRFLTRHMKAEEGKVRISMSVNNLIRKNSSGRPPKSIKVKVTKDKEGIVLAEIAA